VSPLVSDKSLNLNGLEVLSLITVASYR
jgi:hypothetical protein